MFVWVGVLVGCVEPGTDGATDLDRVVDRTRAGEVLPDFTLDDVNATSPTAGRAVSVSDQRGRVSAWYFGHST